MNRRISRYAAFVFAFACPLALTGCLVSSDSSQKTTGNYVAESTLDKTQPGKTPASWVQATLGEPDSKQKIESTGSELWKYSYTEKRESSGAVFLIFAGHDTKETNGHAFVEMRDGVVINK